MNDFLKKNKLEIIFYFFLLILISAVALTYNTIDMDYWARLIQGNFFWMKGHILTQDIFSFTPTHTWLDHEWGASVIFSFIQNHFGFNGIICFRILISFLICFFIYKTIKIEQNTPNLMLNLLLFTTMIYALPTIFMSGLRCHFFTFLFFTVFLYILEKIRKTNNNKLLFLLPLIMLFWGNIHGGCVSGLGLLLIYTFGEAFNKKPFKYYLITLIVCFGMLFINPYGIDYVKFIFMATTMPRPFVTEWISPFSHPVWNFMLGFKVLFILNIFILFFKMKIETEKKDITKYLLLIICAFLSCRYVKNTPFFIIVSAIFLYENYLAFYLAFLSKHAKKLALVFAGFILLVPIKEFFQSFPVFPISAQPYKAVEFIRMNNLNGNIIAPFDYGSYIIYKLFPNNLIYMDGRYEEVYYKEQKTLIDNFYNIKGNWTEILNSNPDLIIIPTNALVNDYMSKINNYSLIYNDGDDCIYTKNLLLKQQYLLPTDDYKYYIKCAFDTNL